MGITKRTHSNPCFWTALWNEKYYEKYVHGEVLPTPREQMIYSLNVKANKIFYTNVNNVHYDKLLGISEISPQDMRSYYKKNFPTEYENISSELETHPESLFLDFENIWTHTEKTFGYRTLLSVIKKQKLETETEKLDIATFITIQNIRSHAIIHSMIEMAEDSGSPKFEYYLQLHQMLADPDFLYSVVAPLVFSKWQIYTTEIHYFPLPDTPIFIKNRSLMVALSPRMFLEIDLGNPASEFSWEHFDTIPEHKYKEFRTRCISNTFKEIIFSNEDILIWWKKQREFKQRVNLLSTQKKYNSIVKKEENRELWKINAFGNLESSSRQRKKNKKKNNT